MKKILARELHRSRFAANRVQLHKAPNFGVFCYLTAESLGY
ncbi:hypothetical protein YpMG051020_4233 [Yersinia pestis biovar Orientalis str. MG05-1020]|nr:hypothetical protein YpMG051020_4233 [Yersinia pestis biovar Orientalis str. MG05-1020]EDR67624.1 hypothetical protein YpK1973002_2126 [Yersinia pestis biovar Mediaevalis str. K1973002]EIS28138.1 hypothetical protein YPPY56_4052 [Yersinia pestis PY-56]